MILKLLTLEWKKLSANRTFVVLTLLYLVFLPVVFLVWKLIPNMGGDINSNVQAVIVELKNNPYMFPHVWKSLGYIGSWFNFYFVGIIGILIITNEYDYKTLRQSIINGLTRKQYFLGKVSIILMLAVMASLYFALVGLLLGFWHTDYIVGSKIFQHSDTIFRYALQIVGYMSFAMFFGWIFRRFALSLIIYLFYPILESILVNVGLYQFQAAFPMYLPISAMKNLVQPYTPIPQVNAGIIEMAVQFKKETGLPYFLENTTAIAFTLLWIIIFIFLSYRRFMSSDL